MEFQCHAASSVAEETFDRFASSAFPAGEAAPELRGILIDPRFDLHVGRPIGMGLRNEATQLLDVVQELVDKPADPLKRACAPRIRGRLKLQCWFDHRPAPTFPHTQSCMRMVEREAESK
jgi:hypothetical protein